MPLSERIVKKAEAAFNVMPHDVPEFDHFYPSDWLIRNPTFLVDGPELDETLGRFAPPLFADKHTQEFYQKGNARRLPPDISKRTMRKLEYIELATCLDDLQVPPSNQLHKLERERQG